MAAAMLRTWLAIGVFASWAHGFVPGGIASAPHVPGSAAAAGAPAGGWAGVQVQALPPQRQARTPMMMAAPTFNINNAVSKEWETKSFTELADADIGVLQGLGPVSQEIFQDGKGPKTVRELAEWKYYNMARALVALRDFEEQGESMRDPAAMMNFNNAVDKEWESKSLSEICKGPPSLLQGLTERTDELLAKKPLGITTIEQLADFKFCKLAGAIVELAKYESPDVEVYA